MIHATAGLMPGTLTWLRNPRSAVSCHYLIDKKGNVYQLVDDRDVAWHAGRSAWRGLENINRYSIGIELENLNNGSDPYPDVQLRALYDLTDYIVQLYQILPENIVAHYDISPGRKTDPRGLDMEALRAHVKDSPNEVAIIGQLNVSIDHLRHMLFTRGVLRDFIDPIVCAYTAYGEVFSMGNVYPLAQAIHETGWFTSDRFINNFNPAGLGATNDGATGAVFETISHGVLAQYAHLLCYATTVQQNSDFTETLTQFSPRRIQMEQTYGRGSAPTWNKLSGKWNFPSLSYHEKIFEIARILKP